MSRFNDPIESLVGVLLETLKWAHYDSVRLAERKHTRFERFVGYPLILAMWAWGAAEGWHYLYAFLTK